MLPRFEGFILVLHIIGFFAILIPLVTMADHGNANEVFTDFLNLGGFPSQGLSFFVGMVGCIFAFAGGDAAVHVCLAYGHSVKILLTLDFTYQMSEEITNASTAVPASIMLSVLINGSLGFGMLLGMLFCLGDIELALKSPTGYPFMSIFLQATGSIVGTAVMCSIITAMGISTSVGMLATTSRQFWSFARDRGIPGWRIWSQVGVFFSFRFISFLFLLEQSLHWNYAHNQNQVRGKNAVPTYSILLTTCVACLLALINIGSSVAFNDLVAMSISGLYLSYMVVAGLLLYRRCGRKIGYARNGDTEMVNTAGAKLVWGPFHLPGIWGILVNAFALIYMSIAVFFSFWPPSWLVGVETMNFSVVGTMGVILLSLIYYVVRARYSYIGPRVEL